MPPRKGIVKSGNAGNSSRSSKEPPAGSSVNTDSPAPLFPPGSKYPLSLLHERCKKNGWEKPSVDAVSNPRVPHLRQRPSGNGWSFVVTLSRVNKKTSRIEAVRLEPHPPYVRPTALEARHWGATYAMYRFCNGIQLNRVLPAGPRDYWNELATEHASIPDHQKWMYDADPFAARREVDERQAKAAQRREIKESDQDSGERQNTVSSEFAHVPEVKMAGELRDLVEDVVKKASAVFSANGEDPSVLSEDDIPTVTQQLGRLGFKRHQVRAAVSFLSQVSPLASNLLDSSSPLEGCIEYLVLHVPECDLPQRFLPGNNSSNTFVTSTHTGIDDLKKRWIEDKAIKEAGWPAHTVKECTAHRELAENLDLLIVALDRKLIGEDFEVTISLSDDVGTGVVDTLRENPEGLEALGAHYADPSQITMPLFSAPVQLQVMLPSTQSHTLRGYPPLYITSQSVPPYIRLHLLARLLEAMKQVDFIEPGEGFLMAAMRVLEEHWAKIETNGPPDMSEVLKNLIPPPVSHPAPIQNEEVTARKGRKRSGHTRDDRTDEEVRQAFEVMQQSSSYIELLTIRERLPAFVSKELFLTQLETHRVVVVVGETGCGKTTQLPQFILDSIILSGSGSKASIIVTQPRRISAISVAARVSAERADDGSVGYAIRGESKQDKRTKLLFCTTGVVLRRLGSGDKLEHVTHVVVDEVHERSLDGDFLLLELKELLATHPTLKVILMSATINHEKFVRYFNDAPMLTIPGFTHPVTDLYIEDFISSIRYTPAITKSGKMETVEEKRAFKEQFKSRDLDDQAISALQSIARSDRIDYQLVAAVVRHILGTAKKRGGILIFLPGVQEIRHCIDAVHGALGHEKADIFPLHANLSGNEQRAAFSVTPNWKIIAATNVAETSITIDDVIYVIDAGKVKEMDYDPESGMSRLVEQWVTRAAARQRRGRAGRTQPGTCYKLYTRKQEEEMARFPVPEILRTPLESISLTVKAMRESEDVKLFLSRAIDPPEVTAMEKAWSGLEELGAVDQAGQLTALGRHISMLPVDLRLGKMLVLGTIFRCLDPILTIAACLSSKPLFVSPMDKREEANQARLRFDTDNSDLLTDVNAYNEYMRLRSEPKSQRASRTFCEENFISATTLREVTSLRLDFLSSLSDLGFIPLSSTPTSATLNANGSNTNLVKAIVLGGLWPRVARVHLPRSAIKFDKVQAGTVQRENTAKEYKVYDLHEGRVFLHPTSVLFGATAWKSPFLVYFQKQLTSKVFVRGATEIPMYALLLFGGPILVNHIGGGVTIGHLDSPIRLRAWPRIGVLANHLRRLLDAHLQHCIEEGTMLSVGQDDMVLKAILALLTGDGLSR
ncbi:P-loop containing nucleoside triphosphate hydrolase protein [Leucogyrophana mollusca]|uniref:P-loop containing nucleoside triphosphate hydrolase protein n=1 Tax=Leucogyrophana mollusca TaxID=85980 RepID=A0ACB8BBZ0_9AGAM|nr:P-loop containing nucleoside triphosphate hydrolase protein [Leucogyrophana mollusca]